MPNSKMYLILRTQQIDKKTYLPGLVKEEDIKDVLTKIEALTFTSKNELKTKMITYLSEIIKEGIIVDTTALSRLKIINSKQKYYLDKLISNEYLLVIFTTIEYHQQATYINITLRGRYTENTRKLIINRSIMTYKQYRELIILLMKQIPKWENKEYKEIRLLTNFSLTEKEKEKLYFYRDIINSNPAGTASKYNYKTYQQSINLNQTLSLTKPY